MNNILKLSFLALSLGITFNLSAHSEHDKARFVAENGVDKGNCDNPLRPCKSIGYAVQRANKGDKVLVSSGTYSVNSVDELFYLKSNIVPVRGGYNRFDHFQSQSPASNRTTLVGVPMDMAKELSKQGFNVIADGKSLDTNKKLARKLANYASLNEAHTNVECVDGKADIFDCSNVDLISHMPLSAISISPAEASDIWGHVDLNTGKEYAIMGLRNGTVVVDVSDPSSPQEVGAISGQSVTWRDIKVYQYFDESLNLWQAYAYVTLDGANPSVTDHVTIINLNNLPHSINVVEHNETVNNAHNVYISNVDYTYNIARPNMTPVLHLIGTERNIGQYQNYSLATPTTLTPLSDNYNTTVDTGGRPYTHDGASITIDDERKNRDCVNSNSSCTVFIDFNETEMLLWDISDTDSVTSLGRGTYDNPQYVHSGWSTEDNMFVFLHDELDESRLGVSTTVRVFSIEDLNTPTLVGSWTGTSRAIDHNGFVRGNRYYMSNYQKGLTILDITDPTTPQTIGYFDTYTPGNSVGFDGAWGTYPFLPSGNILVSDIDSGLYVLKDNTHNDSQGHISFTQSEIDSLPGEVLSLPVMRQNVDTNATSVSVGYEIIDGSAKANSDYTPVTGRLDWQDNNNGIKSIDIALLDSGNQTAKKFFVRLFDPKSGASLSAPSYLTVNITGDADNSSVSFVQQSITVAENSGQATISVARNGNTNNTISIDYTINTESATQGDDFVLASGSLNWDANDNTNKSIVIDLIDDELEEQLESFTINLANPTSTSLGAISSVTVNIADDDTNNPPTVTLNEDFSVNTTQTVDLTAQASDMDGDELTFLWQQTSGPSVELTNATTLDASFVAPSEAATLTFDFTATDFREASTTKSITITVVAPVTPPPAPEPDNNSGGSGGGSLGYGALLLLAGLFRFRQK